MTSLQRSDTLTAFSYTVVDRIVMVEIGLLKPSPRRSRTHDDKQIAMIMGSFNTFGLINPLIVDENHVILAGHARFEAARRLGIKSLPVVQVDHLSEAEKRAYVIADNRIAEKAGWDNGVLAIEFEYLASVDFDLDVTGFSITDIDLIIEEAGGSLGGDPAADALPEPVPGPAVSRLGDVWQLGGHRIVCGSALDAVCYEALMAGEAARMVLTDPPYNVAIKGFVSGLGKVQHREFAMASGEMSRDEFVMFIQTALEQATSRLIDGGLAYIFIDWRGQYAVMQGAETLRLMPHNLCVWDKMSGGMGSHYRSQHELCWIFKKGTAPHLNTVELGRHGRNRTNVWQHPGLSSFGRGRDDALAMHPTVKPVSLLVEAIKDCSRRGDVVLDPFLGSGSTLMAAERSGCICRGIELDPLYVDTILRRFQAFTGIDAVHVETGKGFVELARIREDEASAAQMRADAQQGPSDSTVQEEVALGQNIAAASQAPSAALSVRPRIRPRSLPSTTTSTHLSNPSLASHSSENTHV